MKRKIVTILLMMFVGMISACGKMETVNEAIKNEKSESIQQETRNDPDATDLVVYFGVRAVDELEEIPTYNDFLLSQEKAYISDFTGTEYFNYNDDRRIFFKEKIDSISVECLEDGRIYERELEIEEIEENLYRVDPFYRIYLRYSDGEEKAYRKYMTFKITVDGDIYYMTWIPPEIN